jgi:hypothetical protein
VSLRGALARMDPWTPEEDDCLRVAYVDGGIALATPALPDRSVVALYKRARHLGLSRRRRWTPGDDLTLEALWGEGLRLSAVAKTLGRTPATVYWRAQKLGLPLGVPDGFEYLSAAAERTGFTTGQLVRILREHGFKVRATLSRTAAEPRSRRHHFVAPGDVDAAVKRWSSTETPEEAARRLGICADRLRARLAALGIANKPGTKERLRVTDAQVEAANGIAVWSHRNRRASRASRAVAGEGAGR